MAEEEKNNIREQSSIPSTKVRRAARFVRTGAKVGGNYVRHYAKRLVNRETSRDELHEANARDVYDTLSELKGSALKVAQMMSLDSNVLPTAYQQQFQMAQYSAPPLSYPLVVKTFQKHLGKSPNEIFDTFTKSAVNAASIGQVHQATIGQQKFAVKVQYPGVAESVESDLRLVKPFAVRIAGLNEKDVDHYMDEVRIMLLSETDYSLELRRSQAITTACQDMPNLVFPKYYPEFSSKRVLTMEWLDGLHLDKFMETNPEQETLNQVGQALWDFYDKQMHVLRAIHADPHPGNFLIKADGTVGVIDFGAVKVLSDEIYEKYFIFQDRDILDNEEKRERAFWELKFYHEKDTPEERAKIKQAFTTMISLLTRPVWAEEFDFGDDNFFKEVYEFGRQTGEDPVLKKSRKPRGLRDALYINRTYFGIFNILNKLKAKIKTRSLRGTTPQPIEIE